MSSSKFAAKTTAQFAAPSFEQCAAAAPSCGSSLQSQLQIAQKMELKTSHLPSLEHAAAAPSFGSSLQLQLQRTARRPGAAAACSREGRWSLQKRPSCCPELPKEAFFCSLQLQLQILLLVAAPCSCCCKEKCAVRCSAFGSCKELPQDGGFAPLCASASSRQSRAEQLLAAAKAARSSAQCAACAAQCAVRCAKHATPLMPLVKCAALP